MIELQSLSEAVREWLVKVERDLHSAELLLAKYGSAAYFAQQAAVKTAKAYLAFLDQPSPKTHKLRTIGDLIAQEDVRMAEVV